MCLENPTNLALSHSLGLTYRMNRSVQQHQSLELHDAARTSETHSIGDILLNPCDFLISVG